MKVEKLDIPENLRRDFLDEGITDLNPPQIDAVDSGLLDGDDMVVAAPTASGKTLIAELAMTKQVVENDRKAVYIVPLKALATEKYQDFQDRFSDKNVRLSIGDLDDGGSGLETADIIVVTSEKLDSILRHNPGWIHEIGLVVVDEIHLLTSPNRGPTLEVTISRLRELLEFQMLGLSATISNSDELADWLDAELVESSYRPVELKHGVFWNNTVEFYPEDAEMPEAQKTEQKGGFSTGADIKQAEEQEIESEKYFVEDHHGRGVLNIIEDTLEQDKQAIIFCSSRKGAEKSADRAGKVNEAELSREDRIELKDYADRIENVLGSPTTQCKRLAENVRKGAAFHHAGLCLSGDSLILHPDGSFSRMKNLIENEEREALGLTDYKIRRNQIKGKYELDKKPVLEIETRTGRKLKVSKNHQLPLLDEKGINWCRAKNLREKDRIACPREINIDVEPPNLRELLDGEVRTYKKYGAVKKLKKGVETENLETSFRKNYCKDRNITVKGLRELCDNKNEDSSQYLDYVMSKGGQKPVKIPEKLDKELAWFIGAVAGDGCLGRQTVVLSGGCNQITGRFEDICKTKFGRKPTRTERDDGVKSVALNSKAIRDVLNQHFGIPESEKAQNLRMPKVGLRDDLLYSYIRGLFDTDGSVNSRKNSRGSSCVDLYSASEDFITEVKTSLLRLGITAFKDKRKTEGRITEIEGQEIKTNGDIHRLTIYGGRELRKFRNKIGFTHPEKREKLENAIEINDDGGRNQNDVIPSGIGNKVRKIRKQQGLSLNDLDNRIPKATLSRFENCKTPMKRDTFQKLAEALGSDYLKRVAHSDIFWDRIENIEEKPSEKLYDISTSTENFIANGIIAHNTTKQRELVEEAFKKGYIKTVSATPTLAAGVNLPAFRVVIRDLKRYTGRGMEYIPVMEYEQMTGRAGRPKYDDSGEAISIAKQKGMTDEILERYILGEPERLQSKLAVEPVLRMHTLSLIASKFCTSMEQLLDFYSKTLYAYQFGDMDEVEEKIQSVVRDLQEYGFLHEDDFAATKVGERVSELYLDPDSAYLMLNCLKSAAEKDTKPISYLMMVSRTTEMQPRLRVKDKEYTDIGQALLDAKKYLLESPPNEWDPEYDRFLESMKTALMLQGWISEVDEERLMEKYGIAPGGVRAKTQNADWLLYSAQELARMKNLDLNGDLKRLRTRLKHGIEEELLRLVKYDQIGRVRARKLHKHGITDQEAIRDVSYEKLKKLIGARTAEKLKKQVGQENIFDRENIMDYFD